jgi:hypothetical protein
MIERVSPEKDTIVALRPDWLDVDEQQAIARKRARVAIPTKQRDFIELWDEEQPKRKPRVA